MRRVMSHISDCEFIALWNAAANPAEVSEKIGVQANLCRCRAYRLRKRGYRLKKFEFGFHNMTPERLREVARRAGLKSSQLFPLTSERSAVIRSNLTREHQAHAGRQSGLARRIAREAGYPQVWRRTEVFIEVWRESPTVEAVAEKIGRSTAWCRENASRIRRLGYRLKYFPQGKPGPKPKPKVSA